MNTRFVISLLCAGALAFACGPRSRSEPGTLASATKSLALTANGHLQPRRSSTSTTATKHQKLDSRLDVDVGAREIKFAFAVANIAGKHVELSFPSGKSYDIVVVDSLGRAVWQWSNGRMFTQGVQNKQLGAGEAMTVAESWSRPSQSGAYTAIATLNSSNFPVEQRIDFVVP